MMCLKMDHKTLSVLFQGNWVDFHVKDLLRTEPLLFIGEYCTTNL